MPGPDDPTPPTDGPPPEDGPADDAPASPGEVAPADPDATQAHDVEALFDEAAGHDDERVADLAEDPGAVEPPIEPVWADDLTTAIPPVAPPTADTAPTTWVPPVAPTTAIPPTPPARPAELEDLDEEPSGGMSGGKIALIVGLVVLVAVIIGVTAFLLTADDSDDTAADATPVALEGADDPGPAPFTANAAERIDLARVRELGDIPPEIDEPADGADDPTDAVRNGTEPGLYTAPEGAPLCDRGRIERDLAAAPSEQAAWAGIAGVPPAEVASFLESLTPVAFLQDTRLTDHRFEGGRAVTTQSILQAGTVVLVDDRGLPRVRCASGSPLLPPITADGGITVADTPWPGFSLDRVQAIRAGQPVTVLVVVDLGSGEPFSRPVGTDGSDDTPIGGATSTTSTSTTSTSTSTSTTTTTSTSTTSTTAPPEPTDVTATGTATASSVAEGSSADLAIDGDTSTSWFGTGTDGEPMASVFTWDHAEALDIERITIVGNGANADSALRTSTGFESVTIEILDNGTVTYSETFGLPGTPDPTINARPAARGNTVRLTFTGPEGAARSGFGELTVIAG